MKDQARDLTSAGNLLKKHQLLEAEMLAREVRSSGISLLWIGWKYLRPPILGEYLRIQPWYHWPAAISVRSNQWVAESSWQSLSLTTEVTETWASDSGKWILKVILFIILLMNKLTAFWSYTLSWRKREVGIIKEKKRNKARWEKAIRMKHINKYICMFYERFQLQPDSGSKKKLTGLNIDYIPDSYIKLVLLSNKDTH